jgi:hypothetical protein
MSAADKQQKPQKSSKKLNSKILSPSMGGINQSGTNRMSNRNIKLEQIK